MEKKPILQDFAVITEDLLRRCIYVPPPVTADTQETGGIGTSKKKQQQVGGIDRSTSQLNATGQHIPVDTLPPANEISKFTFSFCNIHEIKNLDTFVNVTTLQFDNNHIARISGISHMKNLIWLDLSFNQITKIEGLESLTKLEDLTLFGNRIRKLENLDALTELSCFSIGKNEIETLEDILYLRRFKKLRMLTVAGNPLDKDPEHRSFAMAHIPSLKYLDYKLVDPAEVTAAREAHEDLLLELDEKDRMEAAEQAERDKRAAEEAEMVAANCGGLLTLFERMFAEDQDYQRIKGFDREYQENLDHFQDVFAALILDIKTSMLGQLSKRKEMEDDYELAIAQVRKDGDDKSKELILAFDREKQQSVRRLKQLLASSENDDDDDDDSGRTFFEVVDEVRAASASLQSTLLDIENVLIDQIESINFEYTKDQEQLANQNRDLMQGFFIRLQELESHFFEKQLEKAMSLFEKAQTDDNIQNQFDEPFRQLLSDKDSFLGAFNGSHDNRVSRINNREELFQKSEKGRFEKLLKDCNDREYNRNRLRVQEIWGYVDAIYQELDNLSSQMANEEAA